MQIDKRSFVKGEREHNCAVKPLLPSSIPYVSSLFLCFMYLCQTGYFSSAPIPFFVSLPIGGRGYNTITVWTGDGSWKETVVFNCRVQPWSGFVLRSWGRWMPDLEIKRYSLLSYLCTAGAPWPHRITLWCYLQSTIIHSKNTSKTTIIYQRARPKPLFHEDLALSY